MTALASAIDPQSADFARNTEAMKALVADLRAKLDAAMQGGSEEARARHAARGKLLARERINLLLDPTVRSTQQPLLASLGLALVQPGSVPGAPLPLLQSIEVVWPQIVGMIAGAILLFVIGYVIFQRQEVRA